MRIINLSLIIFMTISCATTYQQPTIVAPQTSSLVSASKNQILNAAKKTLIIEGFQIANIDDSAGIISTAPKKVRITPVQADCGKTMGLDYLKDKRTDTSIAYGIIAEDGKIIIKTIIEGQYKPGSVSQDISLTCVSKGILENEIMSKIVANIKK